MGTSITDGGMVVKGDLNVQGNITFPDGADLPYSQLQQIRNVIYQQLSATDVAAETKQVYRVYGATGTILAIGASIVTVPSVDRAAVVDVKKNGTTVLSASITLDSGNTTRVSEAGTLSVVSLAAGDILEVFVTVAGSSGTHPQGLLVNIALKEDPTP